MRRNTEAALDVFRSLGATVTEVKTGWRKGVLDAGRDYLEHLFGASLSGLLKDHADEMTSYARDFAQRGQKSKAVQFVKALDAVNEMFATMGPILHSHDVLICPTNALPAAPADFDQSKGTITINGKPSDPFLGWMMTLPFNMLSRCPVLSCPRGARRTAYPRASRSSRGPMPMRAASRRGWPLRRPGRLVQLACRTSGSLAARACAAVSVGRFDSRRSRPAVKPSLICSASRSRRGGAPPR